MADPLLPIERQADTDPVTTKERMLLGQMIDAMFEAGWNDQEIMYDLNRGNGRTKESTGHCFGPKHLVNLLRALHEERNGQSAPAGVVRPELESRLGPLPEAQGVGVAQGRARKSRRPK